MAAVAVAGTMVASPGRVLWMEGIMRGFFEDEK
jgi:hypothetical protein